MARLDYAALNSTIRYCMWSVFSTGRPAGDDRGQGDRRARGVFLADISGEGVVGARHLRRRGPARGDAELHDLVARRDDRAAPVRLPPPPLRTELGQGTSSRSGGHRRAAPARPSSTGPRTGVHGRRAPASTSASTRSCAPTSGTSWRTLSVAACSSSTVRWHGTSRTCAPTPSRRSRSATTSGCWPRGRRATPHRRPHARAARRAARMHVREEIPFFTGPGSRPAELVANLPLTHGAAAQRPRAVSRRWPGRGIRR